MVNAILSPVVIFFLFFRRSILLHLSHMHTMFLYLYNCTSACITVINCMCIKHYVVDKYASSLDNLRGFLEAFKSVLMKPYLD